MALVLFDVSAGIRQGGHQPPQHTQNIFAGPLRNKNEQNVQGNNCIISYRSFSGVFKSSNHPFVLFDVITGIRQGGHQPPQHTQNISCGPPRETRMNKMYRILQDNNCIVMVPFLASLHPETRKKP